MFDYKYRIALQVVICWLLHSIIIPSIYRWINESPVKNTGRFWHKILSLLILKNFWQSSQAVPPSHCVSSSCKKSYKWVNVFLQFLLSLSMNKISETCPDRNPDRLRTVPPPSLTVKLSSLSCRFFFWILLNTPPFILREATVPPSKSEYLHRKSVQ